MELQINDDVPGGCASSLADDSIIQATALIPYLNYTFVTAHGIILLLPLHLRIDYISI
jgi:hypothetical protein